MHLSQLFFQLCVHKKKWWEHLFYLEDVTKDIPPLILPRTERHDPVSRQNSGTLSHWVYNKSEATDLKNLKRLLDNPAIRTEIIVGWKDEKRPRHKKVFIRFSAVEIQCTGGSFPKELDYVGVSGITGLAQKFFRFD